MAGMMQVPRSRGAISGLLLMLLGAWGALIPFVGPYWHFSYAPDTTWDYTTGRLLLQVLPGVAAFLGGLMTLVSANRLTATFGGWLAAASGAWFVVGMPLSSVWGSPTVGAPSGSSTRQTFEYIAMFGGLGAVIVFLAAFALGRFAVVGVRESALAAEPVARQDRYDDRTTAPATMDEPRYDDAATGQRAGNEAPRGSHRLHWPASRHHAGVR